MVAGQIAGDGSFRMTESRQHKLEPQEERWTAVVTGSSSGIGRAIALRLAEAGADVVVHARVSRARADEVAQDIERLGRKSLVVLADIAAEPDRARLVETCWQWQGGVTCWVNNAGADVLTGPLAQAPFSEKLETLWRTDVVGTLQLSRAIGARMLASEPPLRNPSIINVGWDQAETGMEGDSGEMFAAVKGAIMSFTRSLARSLAPRVRVNCVAPGWIRTAWGAAASEAWQQRARRESILERWGTPADVAAVAQFLVSPAAAFVTGQVIAVNGGLRTGSPAGEVSGSDQKDRGDE